MGWCYYDIITTEANKKNKINTKLNQKLKLHENLNHFYFAHNSTKITRIILRNTRKKIGEIKPIMKLFKISSSATRQSPFTELNTL